nr:hypothetical protein [Bacteroidota bacterium]
DYNGFVYREKLEDALQKALGYHDHQLLTLEATVNAPISWQTVVRFYNPLAGYIVLDQPLSAVLTFSPVVNV